MNHLKWLVCVLCLVLGSTANAETPSLSFKDLLAGAKTKIASDCERNTEALENFRRSDDIPDDLKMQKALNCECFPERLNAFPSEHPTLSMTKPYPESYVKKMLDASFDRCIAWWARKTVDDCEEGFGKKLPGIDVAGYCACFAEGMRKISDDELILWSNGTGSKAKAIDMRMKRLSADCKQGNKAK